MAILIISCWPKVWMCVRAKKNVEVFRPVASCDWEIRAVAVAVRRWKVFLAIRYYKNRWKLKGSMYLQSSRNACLGPVTPSNPHTSASSNVQSISHPTRETMRWSPQQSLLLDEVWEYTALLSSYGESHGRFPKPHVHFNSLCATANCFG